MLSLDFAEEGDAMMKPTMWMMMRMTMKRNPDKEFVCVEFAVDAEDDDDDDDDDDVVDDDDGDDDEASTTTTTTMMMMMMTTMTIWLLLMRMMMRMTVQRNPDKEFVWLGSAVDDEDDADDDDDDGDEEESRQGVRLAGFCIFFRWVGSTTN